MLYLNQWWPSSVTHLRGTVHGDESITWILTHLPLVPHIYVGELSHHWFRKWPVACTAPSHYLNQCCHIVIYSPRNIFQWNSFEIQIFSFKKMPLNLSSAKWRPFYPGGDKLIIVTDHMCVHNDAKIFASILTMCETHCGFIDDITALSSLNIIDKNICYEGAWLE